MVNDEDAIMQSINDHGKNQAKPAVPVKVKRKNMKKKLSKRMQPPSNLVLETLIDEFADGEQAMTDVNEPVQGKYISQM